METDSLPMSHGENISSLISDSGITRFHLKTKIWDIYTNRTFPYWYFPKGIYLEKFDSIFRIEFYIKADTAYFFEQTGQWQLIGNVYIKNFSGDTFETAELFYNQQVSPNSIEAIHTDKCIKINKKDKKIIAHGMKTNLLLTKYVFYNNSFRATFDKDEN